MNSAQASEKIIERIRERAIATWDQDWEAELVRAYAKIEGEEERREIKANQRRSQVLRVFQGGSCTLLTALRLGRCVGISIKLVFEEEM